MTYENDQISHYNFITLEGLWAL